jgi:hypothetical protein
MPEVTAEGGHRPHRLWVVLDALSVGLGTLAAT